MRAVRVAEEARQAVLRCPAFDFEASQGIDRLQNDVDVRLDGRRNFDSRVIEIIPQKTPGRVVARYGGTKVLVVVSGDLAEPRAGAPNEGELHINCRFTRQFGFDAFENLSFWQNKELECSSLLDKFIRQARVIDTESLCVVAGKKCWVLTVDCIAISGEGNLFDVSFLGVIAALKSYRKKSDLNIGTSDEEGMVPLSIANIGVLVSFAQFESPDADSLNPKKWMVIDPTDLEETTASGFVRLAVNVRGECMGLDTEGCISLGSNVHKTLPLLTNIAAERVKHVLEIIRTL